MASVFRVVVTDELLLQLVIDDDPIACLYLGGIASTLFLLLHLNVEASLIDR